MNVPFPTDPYRISDFERRYSDNTRVGEYKDRREFFGVTFIDDRSKERVRLIPWDVAVFRYAVPGRYDVWHFDYCDRALRYKSEGGGPIAEALAQAKRDLDKTLVVKLIRDACEATGFLQHARSLVDNILGVIAPGSKAYEEAKAIVEKKSDLIRRQWQEKVKRGAVK